MVCFSFSVFVRIWLLLSFFKKILFIYFLRKESGDVVSGLLARGHFKAQFHSIFIHNRLCVYSLSLGRHPELPRFSGWCGLFHFGCQGSWVEEGSFELDPGHFRDSLGGEMVWEQKMEEDFERNRTVWTAAQLYKMYCGVRSWVCRGDEVGGKSCGNHKAIRSCLSSSERVMTSTSMSTNFCLASLTQPVHTWRSRASQIPCLSL